MKIIHRGQFAKGNPGRPKGTKNKRTVLWEELGQELTDRHADRFNALLDRLWDSPDLVDQLRAADLFLKVAEYFKPKLQRIQQQAEPVDLPRITIRLAGAKDEDDEAVAEPSA